MFAGLMLHHRAWARVGSCTLRQAPAALSAPVAHGAMNGINGGGGGAAAADVGASGGVASVFACASHRRLHHNAIFESRQYALPMLRLKHNAATHCQSNGRLRGVIVSQRSYATCCAHVCQCRRLTDVPEMVWDARLSGRPASNVP